jgi:hypothetical protein
VFIGIYFQRRTTVRYHLSCFIAVVFILSAASNAGADLVSWWKFDESSGKTAIDSSGNGHDGILNGTPAWVAGKLGGALQFDGGDYVTCGLVNIDTAGTGGMTVCAWINKPAGGDMKMCSNRQVNSAPGGGFTCAIYNDRMEIDATNATTRILYRDNQGPIVPAETWVHLAWVYNNETDTYDEYHDGVLAATQAITTSIGISSAEFRIGSDSPTLGHDFSGMIDDLRIYNHALSIEEISDAMAGIGPQTGVATKPSPENGLTDVFRDVILSWTPGDFADKHNVYLGTSFDDVNNADVTNPLGVLAVEGHDENTFDPGRLEFSRTYYWRVDEVNAPPDSTVLKGRVWSFTVEPFVYSIPAENIIATASSQSAGQGPENTINSSGLDANDLHSTTTTAMWLTAAGDAGPAWIQYEFDKVYMLHEMLVWNYNGVSALSGLGIRNVMIEYSTEGFVWTPIESVSEFPKATGTNGYASDITVDFGGAPARLVRINAISNWFPAFAQFGLSEVRFLYVPANARLPMPDDGTTNVAIDVSLGWRPGREAAEHNVFLSTDQQAVMDETAPVVTLNQAAYGPLSLDLDQTYYWRIDEVNQAETPSVWQGDIWSFTTSQYLVVDDFESYNDIPEGQEGSHLVYLTWIDGYNTPTTNGSTMGYVSGSSLESSIVHGGGQSAPVIYDNSTASLSEVTANTSDLEIGRDWTIGSPGTLELWVYGDPNNSATDRMYVKVNNAKVVYDGDLRQADWRQFTVDLASLGINLGNVTMLSIGFERTGATGGSGMVFIDDIRLYGRLE